jgi:hypothetical protein
MDKIIADILPRFRVLFSDATQEALVYKGTQTDVSAWIKKGDGGTWSSIAVEYPPEKKSSPMVTATLDWLSSSTGISKDVIDSVRQKTEEDGSEEVHSIDAVTLRSIFDGRGVCLRVDG